MDFADVTKLKILRWIDYPGITEWEIKNALVRRWQRGICHRAEGNVMKEEREI